MMEIAVDYLAILLAAGASMAVGFLWYGPLFGKPWMKLKGYTEKTIKAAQKEMGTLYGVSLLLALVTAYMMSHVMQLSHYFFGYEAVQTGLSTALSMWLGFVLPVQTTAQIFGEKNWKLLKIDTGYQLVSLLVMGVVLALV